MAPLQTVNNTNIAKVYGFGVMGSEVVVGGLILARRICYGNRSLWDWSRGNSDRCVRVFVLSSIKAIGMVSYSVGERRQKSEKGEGTKNEQKGESIVIRKCREISMER